MKIFLFGLIAMLLQIFACKSANWQLSQVKEEGADDDFLNRIAFVTRGEVTSTPLRHDTLELGDLL